MCFPRPTRTSVRSPEFSTAQLSLALATFVLSALLSTAVLAQTTIVKSGGGAMITDMGDYALYLGGPGLWRTDGTTAGTQEVKPLAYMDYLTRIGTKLYFVADDLNAGTSEEVWVSDGTTAGTKPVVTHVTTAVEAEPGSVHGRYLTAHRRRATTQPPSPRLPRT